MFQGKNATMFVNNEIFIIHNENHPCGIEEHQSSEVSYSRKKIYEFIKNMYPKQKYLTLVFDILITNNLIDENLYFIPFHHIHIADFCTFLNNNFGKLITTDSKYIKLCKYLQNLSLKFPKVGIKNPVAQKYLC